MSALPPVHRDPFAAVSSSFGAAWHRAAYLFFEAPGSRVRNWFAWGLIVLLAGVTINGFSSPSGIRDRLKGANGYNLPDKWSHLDVGPHIFAIVVLAIVAAVVIGLILLYIGSRFQLVLLEGVIAGEPRIRGVFKRTGEPGLSYFVLRLATSFVSLVAIALALLPWFATFKSLLRSGTINGPEILGIILTVVLVVLPVILVVQVFTWWVYHFALPYLWMRELGIGAALRHAWSATWSNFGASMLFLLAFILAKIGSAIVGAIVMCVTCCVWIWPVGVIALLAIATAAVPLVAILTVPLILVAGCFLAWLMSTAIAPIPVFFRAWSLAFVGSIDPTIVASVPSGPLPGPAPDAPGVVPGSEGLPPEPPSSEPPPSGPASYAPPSYEPPPSYAPPSYTPPASGEPPAADTPPAADNPPAPEPPAPPKPPPPGDPDAV